MEKLWRQLGVEATLSVFRKTAGELYSRKASVPHTDPATCWPTEHAPQEPLSIGGAQ